MSKNKIRLRIKAHTLASLWSRKRLHDDAIKEYRWQFTKDALKALGTFIAIFILVLLIVHFMPA